MALANFLRKQIDATGKSLYRVSEETGISYAMLYRFYHGQRSIRLGTGEKLLDYLGLKIVQKKGGR